MRTATIVLLALVGLAAARVSFAGHKIVRVPVRSEADAAFLLALPEDTDGVHGVDVLSNGGELPVGHDALVRLTPQGFAALVSSGIPHSVAVDDVERHVRAASQPAARRGSGKLEDDWFYHFHSFEDIVAKLSEIAEGSSGIAEVIPAVATSVEGRKIPAIKIGRGSESRSNATLILAGIHAREWIAEGVAMWAAASLLQDYANGVADVKKALDASRVYIVPCYNPDGYTYAREHNRYWRKNRKHIKGSTYGVDLNRNFDIEWGVYGSSSSPSSDTYCGSAPFSEPETKQIADWILTLKNAVTMTDLHSYDRSILRPYGYKYDECPDEAYLKHVADTMVAKVKAVHGTKYKSMTGADLYPASGATDSWTYEKANIVKSFTIELDGNDFVVPDSDIQRQGEEMYEGFKYLISLAI